jgi:hypothetical protein
MHGLFSLGVTHLKKITQGERKRNHFIARPGPVAPGTGKPAGDFPGTFHGIAGNELES